MRTLKYKSGYSNKEVTAVQYVAELVCANNAAKYKIELPMRFWDIPHWKGFYFVQIKHGKKLLEKIEPHFLMEFIKKNKIWSLSAGWIEEAAIKYANSQPKKEALEQTEVISDPKFSKQSNIDLGYLD